MENLPLAMIHMGDHELWKPLNVSNIDPNRYMVSSYGRLFDNYKETYLEYSSTGNKYIQAVLRGIDGTRAPLSMHRLVAEHFIPNPDINLYNQINHIDGKKYNNKVYNLEWSNPSLNALHAHSLGLNHKGEKNNLSTISNKDAHSICKLIQDDKNNEEICEAMSYTFNRNSCQLINAIRSGRNWKHISYMYILKKPGRCGRRSMFKDEQVHSICKCLEKKMSVSDIISKLNLGYLKGDNPTDKNIRENIYNIRNRTRNINISKNYNF